MPADLALGFATNGLDRTDAEREGDLLTAASPDPRTLYVVVAGETALLRQGPADATAFWPAARWDGEPAMDRVVLGRRDGAPVIAFGLDPARTEALAAADPSVLLSDLRSIAASGTVPADETGTLAQAKSLLLWHARHRFCAQCGAPTAAAQAGLRRDCPACNAQHFPRTDPVSIMLVARGERCLLGRQARFAAGSYSCLAGFVSPGETLEDAVRREVKEEAGIAVGRVRYLLSQPWPFPSSLMIGCLGEALDEALTVDREELEDARWFGREEAASMLARRHPDGLITPPPMAIAHHLIRAWVEGATVDGPGPA